MFPNVGLSVLRRFLNPKSGRTQLHARQKLVQRNASKLAKRVSVCLDVRTNDKGDLVVTKGDQYDVRERTNANEVRNLGKPVDLARQYYKDGADEFSFLNNTAFREFPLGDQPMLQVLRYASGNVFVPLTVGGGIRDFTDGNGRFMAICENWEEQSRTDLPSLWKSVVVSIDPRRVYVKDLKAVEFKTVKVRKPGQGKVFDIDLIKLISDAVSIPVIASGVTGAVEHFTEVFRETNASAALTARISDRKEVN
ncbi:Imidazole glycerol phosphate synthase hisHF, chloroplastic [Capsicum baccatum]|uniref:Imidazole glycerol phosphate synthase hisHF, chloroplastic n=1 Tax=Capsicum baccatum TaxID=33114 RepID=A0A2G2VKS3_CAPBA|nr:Imidazole glycerol phosphate synthase hisHF, chloroplastic [Capsicum baccatum]